MTPAPRRPRRAQALHVEIVPMPARDRDALVPIFWSLVGDLAAAALLDGSNGPWEDAVLPAMTDTEVAA